MPNFQPRQRSDGTAIWQMCARPMRSQVLGKTGKPFRPVMAAIVDRDSGFCFGFDLGDEQQAGFELAGQLLAKTVAAQGAPAQVQVDDPELATVLRRRVDLGSTALEVVRDLDVLNKMVAMMERDLTPGPSKPSLLEQKSASIDRLRAFADAAAKFYRAAPWRELHDDDVIEIEAPLPPKGLRCASILGAAGEMMGIGFFADEADFDQMVDTAASSFAKATAKRRWSLMFNALDEIDSRDADLWQENGLVITANDEVPLLVCAGSSGKIDPADDARMTFVEGLCSAIAASTGEDFDRGTWEKAVQTFDGPAVYRLKIPHLLKPPARGERRGFAGMESSMREIVRMLSQSGANSIGEMNNILNSTLKDGVLPERDPADDAERAMQLCETAESSRSRRALQLLHEALRLDPDCAQAYIQLAQRQSNAAAAEPIYRQAAAAGRRTLGEEPFNGRSYPFWGALESRPFMRALQGLAECLEAQDRIPEATQIVAEMLRLNPGDNQGMRYRYVSLLIEQGRLDEARGVLESTDYREEVCALWDYAGALVAFRQGRREEADRHLVQAMKRNKMGVQALLAARETPLSPVESWSPGHPTEAVFIAESLSTAWHQDPEATDWLRSAISRAARSTKTRKSGTRKSGPATKRKRKGKG